jgi:integrase
VPLYAELRILEEMREVRKRGDFVFPGGRAGRPISNMAMLMLMLLRRMGRDDLTAHGLRSRFRDWAAECRVAEMALAHIVSDKVGAAYRRGDLFEKRRQLSEAWAKCYTTAPAAGHAVPIRRPAAAE